MAANKAMNEAVFAPEIPPYSSDPPPPYFLPSPLGDSSRPPEHRTEMMPPNPTGFTNYAKYVALSILTTFCCCPPLGLAAFVFSVKAHHSARSGDAGSANTNSHRAWTLNMAAITVGLSFYLGFLVFECLQKMHSHVFSSGGGKNESEGVGPAW